MLPVVGAGTRHPNIYLKLEIATWSWRWKAKYTMTRTFFQNCNQTWENEKLRCRFGSTPNITYFLSILFLSMLYFVGGGGVGFQICFHCLRLFVNFLVPNFWNSEIIWNNFDFLNWHPRKSKNLNHLVWKSRVINLNFFWIPILENWNF